jgi:hypothetical protein
MDLTETGHEVVNWIHQALDRVQRQAHVKRVMNKQLLASQEGLCSMILVILFHMYNM